MTTSEEHPVDVSPPHKKSWGIRFSFLSMILLVTIAAFAASHWRMSQELARNNARHEQLAKSLGIPTVSDPAKVTAIGVPLMRKADLGSHFNWEWHLVIPEGKEYDLFIAISYIPAQGLPKEPTHVQALHDGEVRINLSLDRSHGSYPSVTVYGRYVSLRTPTKEWLEVSMLNNEGEWIVELTDWGNDKRTHYTFADEKPAIWMRTVSDGIVPEANWDRDFIAQTFNPDEVIVLRRTRHFKIKNYDDETEPEASQGVMLWLVPKQPESSAHSH